MNFTSDHKRSLIVVVVVLVGCLGASFVGAQTWVGATGNWEDAANWDSSDYPLNLSSPGGDVNEIKVGVFNADSSSVAVTLSGAIGIDDTAVNTTLSVRSGASLILAPGASIARSSARIINAGISTQEHGDTIFVMHPGSSARFQSFALNRFGSLANVSSSAAVIDGAILNVDTAINFSFNGVRNAAILDVKNGATVTSFDTTFFATSAASPALNELRVSGGSVLELGRILGVSGVSAVQNINAKVSLIGSDNTARSKGISMLHEAPTTGNHSMVFSFVADTDGLQTYAVDGNINFDGDAWVDLSVDVSAGPVGVHSFELFTYTGVLNGKFKNIVIADHAYRLTLASAVDDVDLGEYWVDYGDGSGDRIILTYHGIPEGATSACSAGLLGLTWVLMRRRNALLVSSDS